MGSRRIRGRGGQVVGIEGVRVAYFFFLVAFFAEVFSAAGHFCATHGVFFSGQMFFDLRL